MVSISTDEGSEETESSVLEGITQNIWTWSLEMIVWCLATATVKPRPWLFFYGISNKPANLMWEAENDQRSVVLRPGFQSRNRRGFHLFQLQWPSHRWHFAREIYTCCHILCGKSSSVVMQSVCEKRPTVNCYQNTLLLFMTACPHKGQGHCDLPTWRKCLLGCV